MTRKRYSKITSIIFIAAATLSAILSMLHSETIAIEFWICDTRPFENALICDYWDEKHYMINQIDLVPSDITKVVLKANSSFNSYENLVITFSERGARKVEAATREVHDQKIAIMLNGHIITAVRMWFPWQGTEMTLEVTAGQVAQDIKNVPEEWSGCNGEKA